MNLQERLVSVVIPLFNREDLILETFQSLYNQAYTNWEAIVVDDGSTDNSFNVVEEEAKKDKRIKLFIRDRQPKGAPVCRNIGIEKSSGKYVIFLDSDDLLAHYCIQERLEHFEQNKDSDYLVFNGAFFNEKPGDTSLLWNKFTDEVDFERFLKGDVVWSMIGSFWKKQALIKNNLFFDELAQSGQDWEFHIKAFQKKMKYKRLNKQPDYFVRRGHTQANNAISSTHYNTDKFFNRLELYQRIFQKKDELNEKEKNMFFKNIYFQLFGIYKNLSKREFQKAKAEIKKIPIRTKTQKKWYRLIRVSYFLNKIGFKKTHNILYLLSKKKLSEKSKQKHGYMHKMNKQELKILINKLYPEKVKN